MRPPPALRFAEPAALYDLCHQWLDHRAVLAPVVDALHRHGLADDGRVLEACCGTGLWLAALPPGLRRLGFDLDAPSLAVARARLPDATLFTADLRDWRLPATVSSPVDAIIAIFGALAYLDDLALPAGIHCLAAALRPGGLLVAEPWVSEQEAQVGVPALLTVDTPHIKLSRHVLPVRTREAAGGAQVHLSFHHLLTATGLPPRLIVTEDRLSLRSPDALDAALRAGGFVLREQLPGTAPGRQIGIWQKET